jgi:hypothetical protein
MKFNEKNMITHCWRNSIIERIGKLTPYARPKWGKMKVTQMLVHCDLQIKIALGRCPSKNQSNFLTRTLARQLILRFEWFTIKNLPTVDELDMCKMDDYKIEFSQSKSSLLNTIKLFDFFDEENIKPHPVFGRLSKTQWGRLIYIHLNHHLKQFDI